MLNYIKTFTLKMYDNEAEVLVLHVYIVKMWHTMQGVTNVSASISFTSSVQLHQFISSVTQSCPTLCDPMNHSTPGLPVHQQLPEFTQTHVQRVGDDI